MNSVNLIGRTTKDIEVKEYGKKEDEVTTRFSLAVRRNAEITDFINCVAFGKTCLLLEDYVKKGDLVGIAGTLQENNYEDKDGVKHYGYQVLVNSVDLIQAKQEEKDTRKRHR